MMFENVMDTLRQPEAVKLRLLEPSDAQSLHGLVQRNIRHLGKFGDYEAEIKRSIAGWREHLDALPENELALGLTKGGELIGSVSLICYQPAVFGFGYWISAEHAGRGHISEACQILIEYGHQCLGAKEFWAGIKAENAASIAVAEKLGMSLARRQPSHLSYRLQLPGSSQ